MTDPALWSLQRRSVTAAFGLGLSICFIPLPIHLPLAVLVAIARRINLPTIVGTVFPGEPLHRRARVYSAYRVGAAVLREPIEKFNFQLSFDWLQHGLGPVWEPFLIGCLVCSVTVGFAGWLGLELLWRWQVRRGIGRGASRQRCEASTSLRFPLLISSARSMRLAMRISCVTTTRLVRRSRFNSSISSKTCSAFLPSRLPVGSSARTSFRLRHQRTRNCGTLTLAAGKLMRPMRQSLTQPNPLENLLRAILGLTRSHTPNEKRHGHVLQRGELRQQVVKLVDEPNGVISQLTALALTERVNVLAIDMDAAGRRLVQTTEDLQQRGLPRSRTHRRSTGARPP